MKPAAAKTVRFENSQSYRSEGDPEAIAIADINGDDAPDVVTANSYGSDVDLRLNNGDGTLRRAGEFPVGRGPASVAVADLNNDGRLDIVTTNGGIAHGEGEEIPGSDTISVLIQQADGWARSDYPAGKVPMGIAIADVNGDKIPDLVTVDRHDHSSRCCSERATDVPSIHAGSHRRVNTGAAPGCGRHERRRSGRHRHP